MLTLFDYLPSQNAWKVRQLLRQLEMPHRTQLVSIFEGEGQQPGFLKINPWGAVPAIQFADGRVLSESSAILFYLGRDSEFLSNDAFEQAKVQQWLSFEGDYVQCTIGSLRYWTLTGKLAARAPDVVSGRKATAERALAVLDRHLEQQSFLVGDRYSVADIAIFAYGAHAGEAGISLEPYPHFRAWIERIQEQPGHLAERHPYSIDPNASRELP